jgi:hypothetical protein
MSDVSEPQRPASNEPMDIQWEDQQPLSDPASGEPGPPGAEEAAEGEEAAEEPAEEPAAEG